MNPALLAAAQEHNTFLSAYGARCGPRYYTAWRYKYGLDESVRSRLYGFLMLAAVDVALEEGWRHKRGRIQDFVNLALNELARPLGENANAIRAAYLNVGDRQWFRLRKHYEVIFRIVDDWANMGYSHVNKMQRC